MGLLTSRVTSGVLALCGEHDISQESILELMEAKI